MKKSLVSLAALAAAGVASAQSSLTMFGVVDTAVTYIQTTSSFVGIPGTPGLNFVGAPDQHQSQWSMTSSGYNASRLGFRGTEDLGGGVAIGFWLEAGMTNDDGAIGLAAFNRRSTVSLLSSSFGEIRLGRDYVPTFWNDDVFSPFGTNGVGASQVYVMNNGPRTVSFGGLNRGLFGNPNATRASNSIGYFLPPDLGGFYGQAMYAFNEAVKYDPGNTTPAAANTQRAGRYVGGRFGYGYGPLDVAASYSESTTGDNYNQGLTTDVVTTNLGASWDFGVVKLFGEISRTQNKNEYVFPPPVGTGDYKGDGYLLGATMPVGVGLIRVAYSHVKLNFTSPPTGTTAILAATGSDPAAGKFAIGYVHNLSLRTALYVTGAYVKEKNGAAFIIPVGNSFPLFTNNYFTTGSGYKADHVMGYDFGIRHAF
ncbi:porin [Variovorax sp. dw_954]|uniref:porin n=1 Tax=Variovorax sp. dw_954 TaxID=2720078 RepID=UPI001BD5FD02|nr:porin [Variovorax sp. dw_954]